VDDEPMVLSSDSSDSEDSEAEEARLQFEKEIEKEAKKKKHFEDLANKKKEEEEIARQKKAEKKRRKKERKKASKAASSELLPLPEKPVKVEVEKKYLQPATTGSNNAANVYEPLSSMLDYRVVESESEEEDEILMTKKPNRFDDLFNNSSIDSGIDSLLQSMGVQDSALDGRLDTTSPTNNLWGSSPNPNKKLCLTCSNPNDPNVSF
jgi:hypothetical protein